MRPPSIDDVELNAYVDGELPSGQAAALARRAAREPDLALRIAHLHRLKAAVAVAVDAGTERLPDLPDPESLARQVKTRSRTNWRLAGLAAVLVLGVGIGGAAVLRVPAPAPDPAVALHDAWASGGTQTAAEAPVWLTSVIEATGLRLVRSAPLTSGGLPAGMHYGFVGSNDCRLSLFETQAADRVESALTLTVEGDLRSARWQTDAHVYLVVARNMDAARFATIAAALVDAAASRTAPDAERVALLNAARQRCLS
jgi:hypothetical protein